MRELVPVRSRSPAFSRGLTVMHTIDESSPLNRATPESLRSADAEVIVTLVGIDATTGQYVHARWSYLDDEVLFDHHFADLVTELPDGRIQVDLRLFNEIEPEAS